MAKTKKEQYYMEIYVGKSFTLPTKNSTTKSAYKTNGKTYTITYIFGLYYQCLYF